MLGFTLSKEHAKAITQYVRTSDIKAYVEAHPEEFANFLNDTKNVGLKTPASGAEDNE